MALTKSLSFSLGRKRVLISNNSCDLEHFCADFQHFCCDYDNDHFTPLKKLCSPPEEHFEVQSADSSSINQSSLLEALPQEILIKVVCGVDHDDLKQLYRVSKTIRDAAIIAKKSHFAYSTPSKTKTFKNPIDMLNDLTECEAPSAPKQSRRKYRPRLDKKKLDDIAVALFPDEEVELQRSPRRSLFMDIE